MQNLKIENNMEFIEDYKENSSSYERFYHRLSLFKGQKFGVLRHHFYWLLHNNIIHPWIGLSPSLKSLKWHEITSDLLNNYYQIKDIKEESLFIDKCNMFAKSLHNINSGNKKYWIMHNCISHPLIGLFPVKLFFDFHDETAKKMNVNGWV